MRSAEVPRVEVRSACDRAGDAARARRGQCPIDDDERLHRPSFSLGVGSFGGRNLRVNMQSSARDSVRRSPWRLALLVVLAFPSIRQFAYIRKAELPRLWFIDKHDWYGTQFRLVARGWLTTRRYRSERRRAGCSAAHTDPEPWRLQAPRRGSVVTTESTRPKPDDRAPRSAIIMRSYRHGERDE